MHCPICHQTSQIAFTAHCYGIRQCAACSHRFADLAATAEHTQQVYGDGYFQGGGAGYSNYLGEARLLRDHGRWYGRKLRKLIPTGRLLDVGAAAGFVLQGFQDEGWQGEGVEPNGAMAAYAREQLGLTVRVGELESLSADRQYDLICLIQVIAHLADLRQALAAAAAATKPHGHWLVETWHKDSLTARLFGRHWHEYSPPSVLHWFNPRTLATLAAQFGFREVARGRPSKWLNAGHATSLLKYKLAALPLGKVIAAPLGILPEHLSLPYPGDDLFWMLLRKE